MSYACTWGQFGKLQIYVVMKAPNFMESGIGNMGDNLEIELLTAFVNELLVMEGKNEGTSVIL